MKKHSKRVLSVLLSIIMVLSIFTIIPFTASAAETPLDLSDRAAHPVITSGDYTESGVTYIGDKAFDGNTDASLSNQWYSTAMKNGTGAGQSQTPAWIIVDLGEGNIVTDLSKIMIYFKDAAYALKYSIYTSDVCDYEQGQEGVDPADDDWTLVYDSPQYTPGSDGRGNSQEDTINIENQNSLSRYVCFYFEQMNYNAGANGVRIREIEIYATLEYTGEDIVENVALNKTVYVSGNETANTTKDKLVDGTNAENSRWASQGIKETNNTSDQPGAPAWVVIDFGEDATVKNLQSIVIAWNMRQWATQMEIYTADSVQGLADETDSLATVDTDVWTKIGAIDRQPDAVTNQDNANVTDTLTPDGTETNTRLEQDTLGRYLLFYLKQMNYGDSVGGKTFSIREIYVNGTLSIPEVDYISVYTKAGDGAKNVAVSADGDYVYSDDGALRVPANEESVTLHLKSEPGVPGLSIKEWRIEEDAIEGDDLSECDDDNCYQYIYTPNAEDVGTSITLTAVYNTEEELNGSTSDKNSAGESTTLRRITSQEDLETLRQNSDANSANSRNADDGTISGGSPAGAFDGSIATQWHQNWGSGYGNNDQEPSVSDPVWIRTGFGDDKSRTIGAIGYIPKSGTHTVDGKSVIDNCIEEYEVYVSDDADFTNPTLVAEGSFNIDASMAGQEQMVYFNAPHETHYVKLVALGSSRGNTGGVCALEINIYEYIGQSTEFQIDLKYVDEQGENLNDEEQILNQATVYAHSVFISQLESATPTKADIAEFALSQEAADLFDGVLNNLSYRYDIQVDSFDETAENLVLTIVRSTAMYTITVNGSGSSDGYTAAYGQLYQNDNGYQITSDDPDFKYWTTHDDEGNIDEILCTDASYTLRATKTMTIYAETEGEMKEYDVYIPEPVISRTVDNGTVKWLVELPVTLVGAMRLNGETGKKEFNEEITDFGLIVVNGVVDNVEEALSSAVYDSNGKLTSTGNSTLIRNSGYNVLENGGLTNKGRYIHQIRFADGINSDATVLGYMVVKTGDNSYEIHLSSAPRSLANASGPAAMQ